MSGACGDWVRGCGVALDAGDGLAVTRRSAPAQGVQRATVQSCLGARGPDLLDGLVVVPVSQH